MPDAPTPTPDSPTPTHVEILVDADACPVKEEVYKVARRHGLAVTLVANMGMRTPVDLPVRLVVVDDGFDAADDWIVAHAHPRSIVVTTDIPLAARCLAAGALALGPKGAEFTEAGIGGALATREFLSQMREHGTMTGGPAPFSAKNRSKFLNTLDTLVHQALRRS